MGKYLSVQLSGELLEKAKKRAEEEDRTVTNLTKMALKRYLKQVGAW